MSTQIKHQTDIKHLATKILDNLNTAIVLLDSRLNVLCVNSAAEMLFGISLHKIMSKPIAELLNDNELFAAIQSALDTNYPFTQRERSIQLLDKKVMVDISVQPILSEDDDKQLLIELSQLDRHLRISREENLLAQHETIQALLRSMAHEVKNPLGGIRGAAQLLERELDNPDLTEYTQVIIDEADRLKKLVNRMLGPNTRPNQMMINIHSVTERVRSLLKADKTRDVKIFFDYDISIPEIKFDPEHLIQAVLNIVRNAAQALSEQEQENNSGSEYKNEKKIIIKTRVLRHFNIGHKRHKLVAKMDIIDNGPGISEKMQERIFMPLITGRAEGTGLGLSIAQSLISQNGGLIECHSKPGKTVFSLLLPIT
ncbi:MAG: PAS domain-containing protein [gamma proteobacterium symbiont of Lucinoma myriamae]|nr:PAS domain-containing protein [gamma proteobacterium symbiont of Lucinoma myriamae]MCU7819602.1 PAS domain-containing protein [gamma proteobacterium symbiont of Lucinoma myriamae]MCU7831967.1 PAS domain-containing protein [gamma proteobacterium symbiont of Lucinoma myriamae]